MQPTELIELVVAILAIALVVIWLRRASARSHANAPTSVKERLGVAEPAEPTK